MNDAIRNYLAAGLSVIPVGANKRPLVSWKEFQARKATDEEAAAWELPVAIVAGPVSGGITAIDFDDGGSAFKTWGEVVKATLPDIGNRVVVQQTPSGGYHVVYRSPYSIENRKLAQRKGTAADGDEDGRPIVLIETRGEGGYFVAAPSPGYVLKRGDFCAIPTLTEDEACTLLSAATTLNQFDEATTFEIPKEITTPMARDGLSPFDDYDSRNAPIDILVAHGWKISQTAGDKVMLCRPGKNDRSISATWNHIPGRFYVFSTSTEFDAGKTYKPSAVYAILEHGRDYVAAAKQLSRDGYGRRAPAPTAVDYDLAPTTHTAKISDYRERIYSFYKGSREAGLRLEMPHLDQCIRFAKGYLNVVTGIPTHGKSEFVDFLMVRLAVIHGWRFVVFSPENYPLEIHFNKLAEKYRERNMWGLTKEEYDGYISFVDDHFDFIDATEEELTLETILGACLDVRTSHGVDCLLIDPWNEIEMQRPHDISDTEFTGICLRKLRKFARKNDVCIILVAHPTKMRRAKDSDAYPIPTLYDISGSSHFYNKADNGLVVYRDFAAGLTEVHVKKVKFRTYGEVGMVKFKYDTSSGVYTEADAQEGAFGYDPNN
jgi:hypothetical protein